MKTVAALVFIILGRLYPCAAQDVVHPNHVPAQPSIDQASNREQRNISGWTVHISKELLIKEPTATAHAVELLKGMLEEVIRVVPSKALAKLKLVPLYFSPEYPNTPPRAEYHPNAAWLRENQRDPAMAKGIEFSNVRIFDAELRRMPNFALHELAHAYHDQVLGFEEKQIIAAFEKAIAGGKYNDVAHRDSEGRIRNRRAYAMTNHKEYFAEGTESFFVKNDIFPFTAAELQQIDPDLFTLLPKLWGHADAK